MRENINKKNINKKDRVIMMTLAMMAFCWGVFYEFSAFACGSIILGMLGVVLWKRKKIIVYKNPASIALSIFAFGYWCSIFFALDKGAGFSGALKFTVPWIFFLFMMQFEQEEREQYIQMIPNVAIGMLVLSLIGGLFEKSKAYFFQAERLGGFFQYSNTMALFFLIGLVILCFETKEASVDEKNWIRWIKRMALILGIFFTGSRSVFFFLIIFLAVMMIKRQELRRGMAIILGIMIGSSMLYVAVTNDFQNVGRYLSSSMTSSTLLGRMLYQLDAFPIIKQHLGGVGYKGYFILQPLIQRGVYTTMFVHNDWIQIALDAGIIASLALAYAVLWNLFSKKVCVRNKVVIACIAMHMLIDFDLQYLAVFFVLLSMFEYETGRKEWSVQKKFHIRTAEVIVCVMCVVYGYMFLPYVCSYLEKNEIASQLYGVDTQIKTNNMLNCQTIEEAEQVADEILRRNVYSYAAYNIKAVAEMERQDYEKMIENKKKGLAITKYNILEYEDYIVMLKKAIDHSEGEEQKKYIQDLLKVEDQIEEVLENTRPLAYQLRDKPELELPKEFQEYISFYKNERE